MKFLFKRVDYEDLKAAFLIYGFAVATGVGALLIDRLLDVPTSRLVVFSLLTLAVTLSAAYGGLRAGIITTLVSTIEAIYFFFSNDHSLVIREVDSAIEVLIFVLNGLLISFVIEKYKKTNIVNEYKHKEKEITKNMLNAQEEFIKAREEIKARDEFLSFTSHELKTPLTAMLLQIQTILHSIKSVSLANFSVENLLRMLESAEAESKQVTKMVNDLLNVSLITTGRFKLELEDVDLAKLVKEIVDRFSENLKQKNYALKLEASEPVIAQVDRLRIEQVVNNLISNAIKYGDSKPIHVKVSKSAGWGKIVISDQGIGIPTEQIKSVFAKFERAANAHKQTGLGIGLYITSQIVNVHHGKINVESKPDQGSKFMVELPLKQNK